MRTIVNIVIFVMVFSIMGSVVFAQGSGASEQNMRSLAGYAAARSAAADRLSADKVKQEYSESFYLGFDMQAVQYYIADGSTRESAALLLGLWDALAGQEEERYIEACAEIFANTNSFEQCGPKIVEAVKSIESRLGGDSGWYYDVGKNYSLMFIAVADQDPDFEEQFRKQLDTLGKLAGSAPSGTPAGFVSALAKLGGFATKDLGEYETRVAMEGLFNAIDDAVRV